VEQQNLPNALQGKKYYEPSDQGFEKEIESRLKKWRGRGKGDGQIKKEDKS
jgi:replication-associated recombination protein RarA